MDLDARPYRSFVRIAELGSFSRAAEALAISQPSLSAQIRELERRLGFDLFRRHNRRISLTPEGAIFLDRARRLVMETDWLNQAARDIRDNQLRIGVAYHSDDIPERCALTDGFLGAHPGMPVSIVGRSHAQLEAALRGGEIDAAITLEIEGDVAGSAVESVSWTQAERIVLARRPVGLVVPIADPRGDRTDPETFAGLPVALIGRAHGIALSEAIARYLARHGAMPIRPPESDAGAVLRFAAATKLTACDLGWVRPLPAGVRRVAITDCPLATRLVLVTARDMRRSGVEALVSLARDQAARNRSAAPPI